jgi:hypothetical protein
MDRISEGMFLMSAQWSLTYLKTESPIEKIFDVIVDSFRSQLEGRLYDLKYEGDSLVDTKLDHTVVEKFTQLKRAKMIVDSHIVERLNQGVIVYPKVDDLYTLVDTIHYAPDVFLSARSRRADLSTQSKDKSNVVPEGMLVFIDFLTIVTRTLNAEVAHIMFERNPATRATSVHFFDRGQFVDDYYHEDIPDDVSKLIELPVWPSRLQTLLDGRFGFLAKQPRLQKYDDDEIGEVYFDGEDLDHDQATNIFDIKPSRLYVPFWDDNSFPYGAVYSYLDELPSYFVERYKDL